LDDFDPVPPSGIVVSDETGAAHRMTPVVFPPAAPHDPGLVTKMRFAWARMRHGVKESRAEMTLLWTATAAIEEKTPSLGRRLRTLLSFFEWDRADVLRAAWIGLAVFFFAATLGAVVFQVGSP
jgi:hypothetical protein